MRVDFVDGQASVRKSVSSAICYRGAYIRGALHTFKNEHPPQSGPYLLLERERGLFSGGYSIGVNIREMFGQYYM